VRRAVLAAALVLAGCAQPRPGDRPAIVLGRHECARCGMIVSEQRYAGGWVADDGSSVAFDDVGEMLAALRERPELRARSWVADFASGDWLRLSQAHVLKIEGLATPMGTGWAAFARREDARAVAERKRG
jgi:nitrous oxide reductase accessory protein NosL